MCRLVLSSFSDICLFILSRVVCSLEHDLRSTMSSQKPRKTKQKSLLSRILRLQKYQRGVLKAAKIMLLLSFQLPLLGDRPNQPRNLSLPSKSYGLICWTFFQSLGNARKLLQSEICTLGKLMLGMPATNTVSKRSFSA